MVKMGMADEDPICSVNVVGREARTVGSGYPVDVGIKKYDQLAYR
jgi:hypothetical protein